MSRVLHIFRIYFDSSRILRIYISLGCNATFKMDKSKDGHIPTCMLNNKTNLFSHMLVFTLHTIVLSQQDA